jgi:hypothetical protein
MELGFTPDDGLNSPLWDNWVPVDYASRAIVAISLQETAFGRVAFHISNPVSFDGRHLFQAIRLRDSSIRSIDYARWRSSLGEVARSDRDNALLPLIHYFVDASTTTGGQDAAATDVHGYLNTNTEAALAACGIHCPVIDDKLVNKYVAFFERTRSFDRARLADMNFVATS